MKKLLILFALMLVTFTANAQSYIYDVNFDGVINISDISCLVNKILGETNPGEDTDVSPLQLSTRKLDLAKSSSGVVEIISGSGSYNVHSCNEAVATASLSGTSITVTAIDEGKTFITVTDTESGHSATIKVVVEGEATPSYLTCPDENHPHIIDLGLPSGTKWACCNVGADKPEAFGGYYSWGETEEKSEYKDANYQYCTGVDEDGDGYYESVSNWQNLGTDIAGTKYDVAHVKWGGSWVMPCENQMKELVNNCSYVWVSMIGVIGGLFTSPNGNSIFFPAAGSAGYISEVSRRGGYWSSTQRNSGSELANFLSLNSDKAYWFSYSSRSAGYTVRPVYVDNATKPLVLSMNNAEIYVGESTTVEISSGSGDYVISNSNTNVVTASLSGVTINLMGITAGSAVVTVKDMETGNSLDISVTVAERQVCLSCPDDNHPHMVDLGLPSGTKWACCNVGADKPEAYGGYYAWGGANEPSVYNEVTYQYCTGLDFDKDGWYDYPNEEEDGRYYYPYDDEHGWYDDPIYPTYQDLGDDIAGTEYDVAHVQWGGSWVMPSDDQIKELVNNCSFMWTTMNGINGMQFMGLSGATVFLPAAGSRSGNYYNLAGSHGKYWSSTQKQAFSLDYACCLDVYFVSKSYALWRNSINRYSGLTVRPVSR